MSAHEKLTVVIQFKGWHHLGKAVSHYFIIDRGIRLRKKTLVVLLVTLTLATALATGCIGGARTVKEGDTVKLQYTGRLENGEVFDTTQKSGPLEVTLGKKMLIPGLEEALIGMKIGESKTVTIPAEKAYGPHRDDLVVEIPREDLPEGMDPKVGQPMVVRGGEEKGGFLVVIIAVGEKTITVDANHRLAGEDLTLDIKVLEIK